MTLTISFHQQMWPSSQQVSRPSCTSHRTTCAAHVAHTFLRLHLLCAEEHKPLHLYFLPLQHFNLLMSVDVAQKETSLSLLATRGLQTVLHNVHSVKRDVGGPTGPRSVCLRRYLLLRVLSVQGRSFAARSHFGWTGHRGDETHFISPTTCIPSLWLTTLIPLA